MRNKMKKVISATILVSVLCSTMQPISVNAFKAMDVCNSTGWDSSWNYYDQKCTKDWTPSDNIKEKEDEKNNTDKNIIDNSKKVEVKKVYNLISSGSTNSRLKHIPFWLMKGNERNARKDEQLCKIAYSFDILNDDGTLKYTYYPQGCKAPIYEGIGEEIENNDGNNNDGNNNDEIDNFLGNIFWDNIQEDNTQEDTPSNETTESDTDFSLDNSSDGLEFIDNIFSDSSSLSEDDIDFSSASDEPIDEEESLEEIDNVDDLLKDIFSYNIDKKSVSLKGSKFIKTIRDYSKEKVKIRVWAVEANILWEDVDYTSKVVKLLSKIDEEFKIDSIKNDLSKNISNISFSLSTYQNTKDSETKKVFKNKLIKDLQTLKKKYSTLKKKDYMISKTLEKRGQL